MNTIVVSKKQMSSVMLPGMGRSIELNGISDQENIAIRQGFSQGSLQVEFEEERGTFHRVINIWPDPHSMTRITIFI